METLQSLINKTNLVFYSQFLEIEIKNLSVFTVQMEIMNINELNL